MRRLLILCLAVLAAGPAFAADQFRGFKQYVDRSSLKPFTRDLGGILGSASFHNGRSLGFSGFDLGAHGGIQFRPSAQNQVMRRAGVKAFGLPWVQAEIGLPFRLDGFIRGISYQGITIAGGGLRYGILKASDQPWTFQFLLSSVAHSVVHKDFSASHVGANIVGSIGTPRVAPYLGAGIDRTRVVVRAADYSVIDPTFIGADATTLESRFTAGLSVRPTPFIYVQAAMTLAHGIPGMDTGFGIRF
ncbi:MAG: hypothetical protein HY925_02735 [Elusimicrobia bacterium]|nr:hypothetical protein [Elusimicrobiota bacterium]